MVSGFSGGKRIAMAVVVLFVIGSVTPFASGQQHADVTCDDLITLDQLRTMTGDMSVQKAIDQTHENSQLSCSYQAGTGHVSVHFVITPSSVKDPQQVFQAHKTMYHGVDISGVGSAAFRGVIADQPYFGMISSNGKYYVLPMVLYVKSAGALGPMRYDHEKEIQITLDSLKIIDANLTKSGTHTQEATQPRHTTNARSPDLDCQGIFSMQDVQTMTGMTGWKQTRNTFDLGPGEFDCEYLFNDSSEPQYSGGSSVDVRITPSSVSDPQFLFNTLKSAYHGTEVPGIGSAAFQAELLRPYLGIVSSNKKYYFWLDAVFRTNSTHKEDKERASKIQLEAAKIIDANLNKY